MLISTHRVKANRSATWRDRSPGGRSTINPAQCGDTTLAHQNHFVWYGLMTTDADAATAFYRDIVGWGAEDSGHPDLQYTLLTVGGTPVSGLMAPKRPWFAWVCGASSRPCARLWSVWMPT